MHTGVLSLCGKFLAQKLLQGSGIDRSLHLQLMNGQRFVYVVDMVVSIREFTAESDDSGNRAWRRCRLR